MAVPNSLVVQSSGLAEEITAFATQDFVLGPPSKRDRTAAALYRSRDKSKKIFRLRSSPDPGRSVKPKSRWGVSSSLGSFLSRSKSETIDSPDTLLQQSSWHCSNEPTELDSYREEPQVGRSTSLPDYYSSEQVGRIYPGSLGLSSSFGTCLTHSSGISQISEAPPSNWSVVEQWPPRVQMHRQTQVTKIERDVISPTSENGSENSPTQESKVALYRKAGAEIAQITQIAVRREPSDGPKAKPLGKMRSLLFPSGKAAEKERENVAVNMLQLNDTFLRFQASQIQE